MDERIERFIERMGILGEAEGLSRIAGRIFGFLLLEVGAASLDDIAAELGVSKASVSIDARRLEQLGYLERSSRPADRRDYYSISADVFTRSLEQRMTRFKEFRSLIEDARALPLRDAAVRKRLDNLEAAYDVAVEAIEAAIETWQKAHGPRGAHPR
jgi:DNA-binding transcriptional regulator GbsR (MarR family)